MDWWPECPSRGRIDGAWICPDYLLHDRDHACLGFVPAALNRLGRAVYGWHIRSVFAEDSRQKGWCVRRRVRETVERALAAGPVREYTLEGCQERLRESGWFERHAPGRERARSERLRGLI